MARDVPMPPKDGPQGQEPHMRRLVEQGMHGLLFLLNYISYIEQGGFDVPAEQFAPKRGDETDEQFAKRREVARLLKETQAAAGSWAELCTEELRHIRPSDASGVVHVILDEGFKWCTESGYDATADGYRDGALPLLHAMCPDEHRHEALDVLDMFWNEIAFKRNPAIKETSARYPIGTIHTAAAMTGWLFSEPACVPDRATTKMNLIQLTKRYTNAATGHARYLGPP
jgi:hypothetical protein